MLFSWGRVLHRYSHSDLHLSCSHLVWAAASRSSKLQLFIIIEEPVSVTVSSTAVIITAITVTVVVVDHG